MPLTWPLPLSEFLDGLPIAAVTMRPGRAESVSETGGGELITHKLGARLWQGEITLDKDYHAAWAAIEARLSLLEEPGASFLISDPRLQFPIDDPDGSKLGAAEVQVKDVLSDGRTVRLQGLPPGYVISDGDLFSFTYGSNPVRYALHRVVVGGAAFGNGQRIVEVTPSIRPGAAEGDPVTLIKPVCKARIIDADYGSSRAVISRGGSFRWMQTLR